MANFEQVLVFRPYNIIEYADCSNLDWSNMLPEILEKIFFKRGRPRQSKALALHLVGDDDFGVGFKKFLIGLNLYGLP